ncbi:uncharacterized protein CLUP02_05176 [Colletotrichum lupini]|uniref:Uncharacterized protein n=1 Tax=Colletotrichum lupini TaxID=145971 RepID=A0A9Q8SLR7_9PEZI|nr:uncharacterized protein CLUP02_05176 [Colletotrichum lupini]UQC79696.1 hypothetical protein CLUP02_05176 [Colletotrichum lupini]
MREGGGDRAVVRFCWFVLLASGWGSRIDKAMGGMRNMVEGDEDPWMCFLQAEASKGWREKGTDVLRCGAREADDWPVSLVWVIWRGGDGGFVPAGLTESRKTVDRESRGGETDEAAAMKKKDLQTWRDALQPRKIDPGCFLPRSSGKEEAGIRRWNGAAGLLLCVLQSNGTLKDTTDKYSVSSCPLPYCGRYVRPRKEGEASAELFPPSCLRNHRRIVGPSHTFLRINTVSLAPSASPQITIRQNRNHPGWLKMDLGQCLKAQVWTETWGRQRHCGWTAGLKSSPTGPDPTEAAPLRMPHSAFTSPRPPPAPSRILLGPLTVQCPFKCYVFIQTTTSCVRHLSQMEQHTLPSTNFICFFKPTDTLHRNPKHDFCSPDQCSLTYQGEASLFTTCFPTKYQLVVFAMTMTPSRLAPNRNRVTERRCSESMSLLNIGVLPSRMNPDHLT